ncbi:MAG TPA: DNA recombination protein RmuC [Gammaproteobacteria bacterium]
MMLDESPFTLILLAALAGLVAGLVIALIVRVRLKAELDARDREIKNQAALEHERAAALDLASERLSHVFGQLANEQFQSHTETFLKLARENLGAHHERAKGDLAAREQAIEGLLRPVREAIERTERQLQALEKVRSETHGSITKHLQDIAAGQQQLSAETRNLVTALRRPEVRGQWGELTLRRLVELAGMLEHCDFVTQSHTPTPDGAIRPDMVIQLPEGRQLVVDVKTPLDAYLEAVEAPSDAARRAALARHASILAGRVRELAGKAYWTQFEAAPDFVILFIPGDQFLSAALAERPELLDEALRQNVILATPTSFVALLKAIAYGWQQVKLAESAAEIRELAVELHARLGIFTEHLDALGKALADGVKAYNASVGSLERRVLPSARRFTELGVQPRRALAELKAVEELPREGTMLGSDADDAADDSLGTPAEPSGPH